MEFALPAAMRPEAAATFLALTPQRLAKMRLQGDGPKYCKVGRSILYRPGDLEIWLSAHSRLSTSDLSVEAR